MHPSGYVPVKVVVVVRNPHVATLSVPQSQDGIALTYDPPVFFDGPLLVSKDNVA
jgi:hypothetical protein